jgi:probable F420-dependent oxidoreductase
MMKLGLLVRTMGPESTTDLLGHAARMADAVPAIADLWVVDHLAIPPDDAEGSEGRYLEPLATLAYLAGITQRVCLGTAVLVLPYRPPLLTAKWIATIQELSGGRLLLGVGVGWMEPEFRALGVPRHRRGVLADETLAFLEQCFADDVATANGQPFYFRPRPALPPLFVGGAPPHAFRRAIAHRAGWIPMGLPPDALRPLAEYFRGEAARAGIAPPDIAVMGGLPSGDLGKAQTLLDAYREAGATRFIHGVRYRDRDDVDRAVDLLARVG